VKYKIYIIKNRPNSKGQCPLRITIYHNSNQVPYHPGIKVHPHDWDHQLQKAKGRDKERINTQLHMVLGKLHELHQRCVVNRTEFSVPVINNNLKTRPTPKKSSNTLLLYRLFLEEYPHTAYRVTGQRMEDFKKATKYNFKKQFSKDFIKAFIGYMFDAGYIYEGEKKNYTHTNLKKVVKHMKQFGRWLDDSGLPVDLNFQYYKFPYRTRSIPDVIALTKKEFDHLYYFDLTKAGLANKVKSYSLIRDAFVVGTMMGGPRISDLKDLDEDSYKPDKVEFDQKKTGGFVSNPLSPHYVVPVLEKYGGRLPDLPVEQVFNIRLKKLAKIAGLDRVENVTEFRGDSAKGIKVKIKLCDHISTKYMRKTFISILASLGYSDAIIMEFTGHKGREVLEHYRKIDSQVKLRVINEVRPEGYSSLMS